MALHPLNWKAAFPVLTPVSAVHGTQYFFDDKIGGIIAQEVIDFDEEVRQVIGQVILAPSEVPADVEQLARSLDLA